MSKVSTRLADLDIAWNHRGLRRVRDLRQLLAPAGDRLQGLAALSLSSVRRLWAGNYPRAPGRYEIPIPAGRSAS